MVGCVERQAPTVHPTAIQPDECPAEDWARPLPYAQKQPLQANMPNWLVVESARADALERLTSNPYSVLTRDEARAFTGAGAECDESQGLPVLLRCVQPALGTGDDERSDGVRVLWNSGTILVEYAALRHQYMALRCAAVVAILPVEPNDVYVEALTAIF